MNFYKIDDKHAVNLNEILYICVDCIYNSNYEIVYELKIYSKTVNNHFYIRYQTKEEAMDKYNSLLIKLNCK